MKKHFNHIILLLIVLLGGLLRLSFLSNSPPSLNWDEAAWGYNAFSVMETGRDEYGKFLPVFTRSFDEYKSTLPMYLMIPSIKIFGLNEVGVRFPSAFIGTLSIFLIYALTKRFFQSKTPALFAAFFYAIEPWSVHLSRVYHDANIATFFLLLGLYLFTQMSKKPWLMPFSIVCFMLSMYTYNANKLLVPLVMVSMILLSRKEIRKLPGKVQNISIILLVLGVGFFIYFIFKGEAFARVMSTNIFILWPYTNVLKDLLHDHVSLFDFLLHNRFYYFLWEVVGRFFAYLSPANLFIREPLEPSTILAGNSLFHPFEFIPWIVGIFAVISRYKKYPYVILLLFLSPLPAILTWNWFQPGRVMALMSIYSILIGFGCYIILEWLQRSFPRIKFIKAFAVAAIGGAGLISAMYVLDAMLIQLPYRDPGNWQPGFRDTVPIVMQKSSEYNQVIIETPHAQPYIFYLFYGSYPPKQYLSELDLEKIGTPRKNYDFGKFVFREIYWQDDHKIKNTLFVGNEENLPQVGLEAKEVNLIERTFDKYGNPSAKLVGTND